MSVPPNTAEIVGWIAGEVRSGRGIVLEPVPLRIVLIGDPVSYHLWMEKPKQAPSFVSCGETMV
jgi:hypothetical protein